MTAPDVLATLLRAIAQGTEAKASKQNAILLEAATTLHEFIRVEAENTRLRAALAQSDNPCAYCTLPADKWAECKSGFPGCARADDAMGCPELGARLKYEAEQSRNAKLKTALTWYAEKASSLAKKDWHKNAAYAEAIFVELTLDAGECARRALED